VTNADRPTEVLLTGAAGFVGSHLLRRILRDTDWVVHCPVSFKHHGNPERITDVIAECETDDDLSGKAAWERTLITPCDLALPLGPTILERWGSCRYVFNVASSSHVDRSIIEPGSFIQNNVALMTNVLDAARRMDDLDIFLQMSTDEVYGPAAGEHRHREWETILPSNPYSASKAAQEAIAYSYWRTYDLPIVITNTMNIIGERQDPEKFLPMVIRKLLDDEEIIVHADRDGVAGSRFYLHADNLADAWMYLTMHGRPTSYSDGDALPPRYNVVGEREIANDELVRTVAHILQRLGALDVPHIDVDRYVESLTVYTDFHTSRPGHDLRYALDGGKIRMKLGWMPPTTLQRSLENTVRWYVDNPEWLRA
jgi:dTDP-glucose 4,6-dehydratase